LTRFAGLRPVIKELDVKTLFELSESIMHKLALEVLMNLGSNNEGLTMINNLNATMLKILENSNHTSIFQVLIQLLDKYTSDENDKITKKINTLIVRCILKMTKVASSVIHKINVDKILLEMHTFFKHHPYDNLKEDSIAEMSSRAIKTILNEFVTLKGMNIWENYKIIEADNTDKDICIKKWIKLILVYMHNT
jgi:hypothetical protein